MARECRVVDSQQPRVVFPDSHWPIKQVSRLVLWAAGCRRRRDPALKAKRKAPHLSVQGCGVAGMWLRLDVHVLNVLAVDAIQRAGVAVEGVVE